MLLHVWHRNLSFYWVWVCTRYYHFIRHNNWNLKVFVWKKPLLLISKAKQLLNQGWIIYYRSIIKKRWNNNKYASVLLGKVKLFLCYSLSYGFLRISFLYEIHVIMRKLFNLYHNKFLFVSFIRTLYNHTFLFFFHLFSIFF